MHPLISTPMTLAILYRSHRHSSLTPLGSLTAGLTATIHALHPSPLPYLLLMVFFILGTAATKVKADVKRSLTLSSTGSHTHSRGALSGKSALEGWVSGGWDKRSETQKKREAARSQNGSTSNTSNGNGASSSHSGGQEPRAAVQVIANSGCVTALCLLHVYIYGTGASGEIKNACFGSLPARDLILAGIIANYAAVMADTLSSELGILSPYAPRFILSLREVPAGTNGGVTGLGLGAGLGGACVVGAVSVALLPGICGGTWEDAVGLVLGIGGWGALGSVLDSVLGALFQASVVDRRSGKVIEAPNGARVKYMVVKEKVDEKEGEGKPSRLLGSGRDLLDNNQVNLIMATIMTVGGMVVASRGLELPLSSLWS